MNRECLRKVLRAELLSEEDLERRVTEIMIFDSDGDGLLTFKDFYDNMLRKVPQEWLNWISINLKKGVREDFIRMSLEMNGVESQLAMSLLEKTKEVGPLSIGKTFAD